MIETIQAQTNILAVGGIFSSGTDLIWAAMGFLGAVALFMGTVSAIGKVKKEGTGAAITGQIGAICLRRARRAVRGHRRDGHP